MESAGDRERFSRLPRCAVGSGRSPVAFAMESMKSPDDGADRPTVFISSTSADLGSYRNVVRDTLLAMGCFPVLQEYFSADSRSGEAVLAESIKRCDAVVCLVGFLYGSEPSQRSADVRRRSFAHMEYDVARRLKKPVLAFLAEEKCPFDAHVVEEEDKRALQESFRAALLQQHVVAFFSDADGLRTQVIGALTHLAGEKRQERPSHAAVNHATAFISAKSEDYSYAREVYRYLKAHNVGAFLSDESLPELGSSDYRKEIDRALDQAEHMVVVTSSREHVESPWVEAEWGFFINEKRSGRKTGNLITLAIDGLLPKDLPPSLRYYEVLPFHPDSFGKLLRYLGGNP